MRAADRWSKDYNGRWPAAAAADTADAAAVRGPASLAQPAAVVAVAAEPEPPEHQNWTVIIVNRKQDFFQ